MRPVAIEEVLEHIKRELGDGESLEAEFGEPDCSGHRFLYIRVGVWGVPPTYVTGNSKAIE